MNSTISVILEGIKKTRNMREEERSAVVQLIDVIIEGMFDHLYRSKDDPLSNYLLSVVRKCLETVGTDGHMVNVWETMSHIGTVIESHERLIED
jgi:hypothetical protein